MPLPYSVEFVTIVEGSDMGTGHAAGRKEVGDSPAACTKKGFINKT